ncbi:MAG: DNA lyase [Deltaproteobacteria bacterium]|nr:DNA lyase [Deltaproteobacteria bacterium]
MRLWSVHPECLDRAALVSGWREGLLARAVLDGRTRGYRAHPQLERFRAHDAPLAAIDAWLYALAAEARQRGYRFDVTKLGPSTAVTPIPLTEGQLAFEVGHLRAKVAVRAPVWLPRVETRAHPLFALVAGPTAPWERGAPG